ncbi:MAG: stage V sporulation protein SpoVM [Ruminococcus sp.]|nr:stage V sporulation protein SpoVM [Ruminococcus sp.]
MPVEGGISLKIVVVKSPRFLSGILRAIFHIKKEEEQ